MLVPLAEQLGVSVTELLTSRRLEETDTMAAEEVEQLVKTAISCSGELPIDKLLSDRRWKLAYFLSLILGMAGMLLQIRQGFLSESAITLYLLGGIFGAYFCFWVRKRLPDYHDHNRISGVQDGFFRMNVPGLYFNNSNWPYLILVGRIWAFASVGIVPILSAGLYHLFPAQWAMISPILTLLITLGGLFVPMYVVGKKYE